MVSLLEWTGAAFNVIGFLNMNEVDYDAKVIKSKKKHGGMSDIIIKNNEFKYFICIHVKQIHVSDPCNARFRRSRRILEASGRDPESYRVEADGDMVRSVQTDCGIHASGVAAFARQCGPD